MTKDLNCDDIKITAVLKLPDTRPPSSRAVLAGSPPHPEKRDTVDQKIVIVGWAEPTQPPMEDACWHGGQCPPYAKNPLTRKNAIPLTKIRSTRPGARARTRKNRFLLTKNRPMTKTHQPPFEAGPPTRKNLVVVTKNRPMTKHRLKFAILPGVSGGKIQGVG